MDNSEIDEFIGFNEECPRCKTLPEVLFDPTKLEVGDQIFHDTCGSLYEVVEDGLKFIRTIE